MSCQKCGGEHSTMACDDDDMKLPTPIPPTGQPITQDEIDGNACVERLRSQHRVQGEHGNWNCNNYMLGLFNGLECALATMEHREPKYRNGPVGGWLDEIDGGSTFPTDKVSENEFIQFQGMSLRDYFAAAALQGQSAINDDRSCPKDRYSDVETWRSECRKDDAEWCYAVADAMLAARKMKR